MSEGQKVIKVLAICFAIFLIVNILGGLLIGISAFAQIGFGEGKIVVEQFSETYQNVREIEIDTIASNLIIQPGEDWKVEANNLNNRFSSKLQNGTLKIEEENTWFWNTNSVSGEIIVSVPDDTILRKLEIDAGAGKIEISNIEVEQLDIDQGAGVLEIKNGTFQRTDIDGGAGETIIKDTSFHNLKLNAGVGAISIKAEMTGKSEIECGVGDTDLTLLGKEEDYTVLAEKGLGNIQINGTNQGNHTRYGSGENQIKIEGGIGNITIDFENTNNI